MEMSDPWKGTHFALIWTQFLHARFALSPTVSEGPGEQEVAAISVRLGTLKSQKGLNLIRPASVSQSHGINTYDGNGGRKDGVRTINWTPDSGSVGRLLPKGEFV